MAPTYRLCVEFLWEDNYNLGHCKCLLVSAELLTELM